MQSSNSHLTPAQRALVEDNLALVGWMIQRMRGKLEQSRLPAEDAYQEGAFGLCLAARRWDPAKGAFSTYAFSAIRQRIQIACNANYAATAGSETMRMHPELHVHSASLDEYILGTELPMVDLLEDPAAQARVEGGAVTAELLEALTDRERYVIERLLWGWKKVEIARVMGVSSQRVNQIAKVARKRAARYLAGQCVKKKERQTWTSTR